MPLQEISTLVPLLLRLIGMNMLQSLGSIVEGVHHLHLEIVELFCSELRWIGQWLPIALVVVLWDITSPCVHHLIVVIEIL